MQIKTQLRTGFTIIELMGVIFIIAALATLIYVAYGSVRNKAVNTSLMSDLSNASDKLVVDQANDPTGNFPAALNDITWSKGTTTTYTVYNAGTPKTFCLTATKDEQRYFVTQEGKIFPGPCPILYLDTGINTSYPGSGTSWYDLSGNATNATTVNNGGVPTQFTYGSSAGGALTFNGSSYARVMSTPALNFSTNGVFSISVWINPDTVASGWIRGIMVQETYLASGYRLGFYNGGRPRFWTNQSGGTLTVTAPTQTVTVGQWANIVATYKNQQAYLYLNGTQVASGTGTYIAGSNNVYPGLIVQEYFSGLMGNVSYYNTELSESEVKRLFEASRSRYGL